MTRIEENTENAVQYLFGELGEAERDALEDRIFSDEEFSLFVNAVEKDLIDDYVRGEMDSDLRRRFDKNYLISEARHENLHLAEVLQTEVFAEKEEISPIVSTSKTSFLQPLAEFFKVPNLAWAGSLAVILLSVLFGALILLRQSPNQPEIGKDHNTNRQIQIPIPQVSPEISPSVENSNKPTENNTNKSLNIENKPPSKETLPANEKPQNRGTVPPQPQPGIFVATLLPMVRSGEKPSLNIPRSAETIQLRVVHDNLQPFIKYRAEIRDQNGNLVSSREIPVNQKTLARPITLNLRNAALKSGSYEITLSGITGDRRVEEIKFYNFAVNKK